MYDPTTTIRRLAAAFLATAVTVVVVPVAQGFEGPPDAIDRYRQNNPELLAATWLLGGSPDAIDRYTGAGITMAQPANFQGSPDAIDRYRENHPQLAPVTWLLGGSPDAIDRYTGAGIAMEHPASFQGSPDAIDRFLGRTAAPIVASDDGFAWSEFGIGAGSMLGAMLLVLGLGLGALAVRHRGGELSTS